MSSEKESLKAIVDGSVSIGAYVKAVVVRSRESYRDIAASANYLPETVEKVVRLGDLLRNMSGRRGLAHKLTLKGGTALNLMFPSMRRLSVDLDFNYIGAIEREKMVEDKPSVLMALREVAELLDYTSSDLRDKHGGTTITLTYINHLGQRDALKIDVNWIDRVPLMPPQMRAIWQPSNIDWPAFLLASNEELAVGKVTALLDRRAARDVYDTMFLPGLFEEPWPSKKLKRLFVFFSGRLPLPLTRYGLERIDLPTKDFERHLRPVLAAGLPQSREEIIQKAREVVTPLLVLEEDEIEFIDLLNSGELKPGLLFPGDPELAQLLSMHPALLWKARNALEHSRNR